MSDEIGIRKIKVKRLRSPLNKNLFIPVPVVEKISFTDAKSRAQSYVYRIKNTSQADRETHVKRVKNHSDSGQYIDVERVDAWSAMDAKTSAQESRYRMNNNDPPPSGPDDTDSDPHHYKKHVVRYTNAKNPGCWADMELIDECRDRDAKEGPGQERFFRLNNYLDLDGNEVDHGDPINDPNDPFRPTKDNRYTNDQLYNMSDDADTSGDIDPPWRFDPFQNLVNIHFGEHSIEVVLFIHSIQSAEQHCSPTVGPPGSGDGLTTEYTISATLKCSAAPGVSGLPGDQTFSGGAWDLPPQWIAAPITPPSYGPNSQRIELSDGPDFGNGFNKALSCTLTATGSTWTGGHACYGDLDAGSSTESRPFDSQSLTDYHEFSLDFSGVTFVIESVTYHAVAIKQPPSDPVSASTSIILLIQPPT